MNGEEVKTNDILAMLSPEKEKVPLQKVIIVYDGAIITSCSLL